MKITIEFVASMNKSMTQVQDLVTQVQLRCKQMELKETNIEELQDNVNQLLTIPGGKRTNVGLYVLHSYKYIKKVLLDEISYL